MKIYTVHRQQIYDLSTLATPQEKEKSIHICLGVASGHSLHML